jgi:hypothetical protein
MRFVVVYFLFHKKIKKKNRNKIQNIRGYTWRKLKKSSSWWWMTKITSEKN